MTHQFDKFDDIQHMPLRTFNRTIMLSNILEDLGRGKAEEYAALFTDNERKQMYIMQLYINTKGYDAARLAATKDLVLEGETHDEEVA